MAKIIKFEKRQKKSEKKSNCDHKNITVYEHYRTVRCSFCGELIDPFDALLDMIAAYTPDNGEESEEDSLDKEIKKRKDASLKKETDQRLT